MLAAVVLPIPASSVQSAVFISCGGVGGIEEEPLQRGLRLALLDETGAGFVEKRRNLREHFGRGIFQDELGLVFDREQILHAPFPNENAMREDADPIANFLHLREEMGRKKNGDAAPFQIENQVANFARAGGIDARGRLVEHDQFGFLDERLREPDALQHSLGIAAEPAIARILQANEIEQFVRARFRTFAR